MDDFELEFFLINANKIINDKNKYYSYIYPFCIRPKDIEKFYIDDGKMKNSSEFIGFHLYEINNKAEKTSVFVGNEVSFKRIVNFDS